ncbi:DUF6088 family protein [Emticicia sp.]|uniref:DUF6088 family protein n=1 Tax=Emticicia sp. TaxID=1930953 RepID=UPI003752318B
MIESVENKILTKIKKAKRGTVFFIDDFVSFGNAKAINKSLERLVLAEELKRVAMGMYVRPINDKFFGIIMPSIDEIALAIARRDKARVMPTGSYAMYKLGLTTQVPLNIVYYTDASARKIKIGKQTITFKKASAKNLSAIGELSKLAILALKSIGKDNVSEEEINKIKEILKKEKPYHLQHDLKLAPEWIRRLIETNE